MKKFFAIIAIIATMILSVSCRESKPVVEEEVCCEQVDSLCVAVDSLAVEEVVAE